MAQGEQRPNIGEGSTRYQHLDKEHTNGPFAVYHPSRYYVGQHSLRIQAQDSQDSGNTKDALLGEHTQLCGRACVVRGAVLGDEINIIEGLQNDEAAG